MAPINPDKEAEAVETWKKSAQIINNPAASCGACWFLVESYCVWQKTKQSFEVLHLKGINKILGTNYRVMRPDSGLALKILLVGELESHAARENAMKNLNRNEEWQAHYNESLKRNVADHTRIEHYCYNVIE